MATSGIRIEEADSLAQDARIPPKKGSLGPHQGEKSTEAGGSEGLKVLITPVQPSARIKSSDGIEKEENVKRADEDQIITTESESQRAKSDVSVCQNTGRREAKDTLTVGDAESNRSVALDYIHHGEDKKIPTDHLSDRSGYTAREMHLLAPDEAKRPPRLIDLDQDYLGQIQDKESARSKTSAMARFVERTVTSPTISQSAGKMPELLNQTGRFENWFIEQEEIQVEAKPFAKGACGQIFNGRLRGLEVCVKQVTNRGNFKDVKDIRREIALWRSLRHPNITLFIGASFKPHAGVQIIMEKMSGGDLKALVQNGDVSNSQALKYGIQIAKALAWLHGNKPPILHRDLKPGNILFDGNGQAKISDFGLSRLMKEGLGKYKMTGMTGTLRYMAPEVMRSDFYDEKCDIYSLGLLVYFMLTKSHPFSGYTRESRIAFSSAHKDFSVSPQLGVRSDLKSFIEGCTVDGYKSRPCASQCVATLSLLQGNSSECCIIA
uniref:Protein kinase domain-containing protein n=1 Tax=Lotharella globosa TaxID=91324 RepID=A0A7S4E1M1_9EUKA|mmetsp:Transcript_5736/g.10380  ORF Transcript_5736/g.10380 Transcript_5736/m.10380 type:complete len:493 (-) Transcript_5736:145-1623(-)